MIKTEDELVGAVNTLRLIVLDATHVSGMTEACVREIDSLASAIAGWAWRHRAAIAMETRQRLNGPSVAEAELAAVRDADKSFKRHSVGIRKVLSFDR